jgi:site-specific DNA-methyltransferase (adenine-specific)
MEVVAPEPQPSTTADVRIDVADCFDFLASLDDGSVDCVITDPAYSGMNQHMAFGKGRIVGEYSNADNEKWFTEFQDDPDTFLRLLHELDRVLRDDRHLYIMFDSFSLLSLGHLMRDVFNVKNLIVWDKVNLGMGHYFRRRHETIVFACKGKRRLSRRDLTDVWSVKRIHKADYPTQKPVELFSKMLEGSVEPGMTVCDPFCGSGSSALAALRAGCNFVGCDISEKAVELARRRCSELALAPG